VRGTDEKTSFQENRGRYNDTNRKLRTDLMTNIMQLSTLNSLNVTTFIALADEMHPLDSI
jgi:hypothetical protein